MLEFILTQQQKSVLESRYKISRDAREFDRIKAVLLRSEDRSVKTISQSLRKTEHSIALHINDYLTKEKLKPERGGSESHLTDEQSKALIEHISEHT
ncbi:MAG: hypothetical protein PUP46_08060 [Endozoicomonas sp. (ex Botrylloides leachii)]|nr:hypothetical protein [Endozoicomonas sp. (ex Botrylloides leachii)]